MQADRDGRSAEFADAYDTSLVRAEALRAVELASTGHADSVTEETLKELSVQRATTNGFFFTLKTLLKVQHLLPLFHVSGSSRPFLEQDKDVATRGEQVDVLRRCSTCTCPKHLWGRAPDVCCLLAVPRPQGPERRGVSGSQDRRKANLLLDRALAVSALFRMFFSLMCHFHCCAALPSVETRDY